MTEHELKASPTTCHRGNFDDALRPALTIAPGDRVTLHSVSGPLDVLPGPGSHMPLELHDIPRAVVPDRRPHILTEPIRIEGARRGDVLEARILNVRLHQDRGYTRIRPLWDTLPRIFRSPGCSTSRSTRRAWSVVGCVGTNRAQAAFAAW